MQNTDNSALLSEIQQLRTQLAALQQNTTHSNHDQQTHREWQAVFDAVEDLLIITGPDGVVLHANRAALAQFKDAVGKPLQELFLGPGHSGVEMTAINGEAYFPRLGASFSINSRPLDDYTPPGCRLYILNDVTLRNQIEASVQNSQRLADLGALAAGVIHDIRSPLQVIVGVSEGLLRLLNSGSPPTGEQLASRLEMINRNGWRINKVMQSLLAYARDTHGEYQSEDINEIITDTLLLIEHQLNVWANIHIETELAPNIPPLLCERTHISQALINLLTNARDAMPDGGEISIRTGFNAEKQAVFLEVADTGCGIPPEIQDKIFQPFFTTKNPEHGTGLGLSNISQIVSAYGGDVNLVSAPNQGARFTLFFALLPPHLPDANPPNIPLPKAFKDIRPA